MEFFSEYSLFLLKAITVVAAVLAVVAGAVGISIRNKLASNRDGQLEITSLNETYEDMHATLEQAVLNPAELKALAKSKKKKAKIESKLDKKKAKSSTEEDSLEFKKRLYVLNFEGDIKASAVEELRQEITATLTLATKEDEVLVKVESGGGEVHSYGLAASQLQRIKDHGIPLTVSVDKVAASGGYLMACVADKIIAAPFSILGSIGVMAQIPNIHRILKKNDVDIEQLTAGEYKRTLTLLGENTDKARTKMQQELEEVHDLFKGFVSERRPHMDLQQVATGEHWLGTRALELKLLDELITSDDYVMTQRESATILQLNTKKKANLIEKLTGNAISLLSKVKTQSVEDQYPRLM